MKAWRVLMVCGYVLPSLLTILFGAAEGVVGNFTILSRHSIVSQPYPVQHGVRTTVEQSSANLQIECTVCDAGAPTEHCFEDHGLCVALSNTAITIIGTDGFLRGMPHPLYSQCTPRYLQRVDVGIDVGMVVVCHEPCFHLVTITGSTFEIYPAECDIGQGGIVVEADYHGYPSLFFIKLEGNHISESNPYAAIPISDITPHNNCTEYVSLFPLYGQEHFMLWCNATSGERVYVVNRSNRSDAPFVELSSASISSPDGRTFAAATGSILKLYRSNYLQQYPGVKDFGVDITLCTYLNSATLLVGLDGGGQIVIYVETFIDSVGAGGLTTLPYTSSNSRVHKLISQDVYATTNRTGNLNNVLLFNITSGQALDPISGLLEEPVNIFFRHGVAPDPPLISEPPHTPDQLPTSHPSPTTSYTFPATTSTQLTETSSIPEVTDLPKPSPSDKFPNEVGLFIGLSVAIALTITVSILGICFGIRYTKRQESFLLSKIRRQLRRPVEETGEEKDCTPADKSSVGSDGSSSGIGTATQSFISFPPDEDNSLGSGCGNSYFCTEPLQESGHS